MVDAILIMVPFLIWCVITLLCTMLPSPSPAQPSFRSAFSIGDTSGEVHGPHHEGSLPQSQYAIVRDCGDKSSISLLTQIANAKWGVEFDLYWSLVYVGIAMALAIDI